jgi:CDP-diacylglycerol---glycerol-3-phosphate 3-phosphatidyltransferase
MPSIYQIKPAFQRRLRPVCGLLYRGGISPNTITTTTLFASTAMGLWLCTGSRVSFLSLPVFLFLRMAANALDGMIAVEFNRSSPSGKLLNEVADVAADAFLYLPFALMPGVTPFLPVAAVVLAMVSEQAGVAAVLIGAPRRFEGPMGKSDRAFAFAACGLARGLGLTSPLIWSAIFAVIIGLLLLTIFNRCRNAVREAA